MLKSVIFAITPEDIQREGLTNTMLPWEDGQRAPTTRGHFEWWYFDAHFDDGTTAVIVFATKAIINPKTPLAPNLSLTITRPDGRKTAEFLVPPAEAFQAGKEICDVRIGGSHVRQTILPDGRWQYHLHAETANLSADLVFTGIVPPWRPGAGKTYFGDKNHYFAWLPAIPFGSVEGELTFDAQVHKVKGDGYHDHNWGSVALPSVLDHWYWGRARLGEYTLIFVEQIAARKYGSVRMPVFLLAKGTQVLADDARCLTLQADDFRSHPGGRQYPRKVDFTWRRGEEQVDLHLREPALIEAVSLLLALPRHQQRIARLFANPYYFRFNASLDLEINLVAIQDRLQGKALYEIMMLR